MYKSQILLLLLSPSINAFTTTPVKPHTTTKLQSHKSCFHEALESNLKLGGVFLLGLGAAANIALASPDLDIARQQMDDAPSIVLSAGAPKFSAGGSFETMDFSLPSYSDALGGDVATESKSSPPQFKSPFDLKLPEANEEKSDVVEDKAAMEAKKAEEKAAKEKAAAEAKKAEQERMEKEKAARREAEKLKQEEAAARMRKAAEEKAAREEEKAKEKEEAASAPKVTPEVKVPEFKAPEFKTPEFKAPEFKAPDISVPKVDLPSFTAPKVDIPSFSAPKVDIPSFSIPSAPKVDIPAPKLANPPSFDIKASDSDESAPLESQEVRDEKARTAKSEFKRLDQDAKEMEAKAREARNIANVAKKEAQIAKDAACQTRFGGKVLCIRPFGIGY